MNKRVVVASRTFDGIQDIAHQGGDVWIEVRNLDTTADVREGTHDADAVVVGLQEMGADRVAALSTRVALISRSGIGLDNVDVESAIERGISVLYQPDYATNEVATHAVALLLGLIRRITENDMRARTGWAGPNLLGNAPSISEMAIGVVGCGNIGRSFIERIMPLASEVHVFDPFVENAPPGVTVWNDLHDMLPKIGALSLHLPLNHETRNIIAAEELSLLRPGSFLVNVSRGGLVDEDALCDLLESGHLGGAALDVLTLEPPHPDARILSAPRTIITPHVAWASIESIARLKRQSILGAIDWLNGLTPRGGRLIPAGTQRT